MRVLYDGVVECGWRSANVCDLCVVVVCGVCGGAQ